MVTMRVIARGTLTGFVQSRVKGGQRKSVQSQLEAWFAEVQRANWNNSAELKQQFSSASIVSAERVVFNIKGNDYRLIVAVSYFAKIVLIIWLGTHKEYDRIDVATIAYDKQRYISPSV